MTRQAPTRSDLQHILDRIPDHWGKYLDIGPGWYQLVLDLDRDIAKLAPDYVLHQVKEKFGGLRYYVGEIPSDVWDQVADLKNAAEEQSFRTCEVCGTTNSVTTAGRGWVRTLCERDRTERSE